MKTIRHKIRNASNYKAIRIRTISEDAAAHTTVDKCFMYKLAQRVVLGPVAVRVDKNIDNKAKIEKFTIRIFGQLLVDSRGKAVPLDFKHTLHVTLKWKVKIGATA